MIQPSLLSGARRQTADTSREAWDRILPTLSEREEMVFRSLHACMDFTGSLDLTGGELAEWRGIPVTSIRPRLTGLERKGWIVKTPARLSRAHGEGKAHGYAPVLPLAAVGGRRFRRKERDFRGIMSEPESVLLPTQALTVPAAVACSPARLFAF